MQLGLFLYTNFSFVSQDIDEDNKGILVYKLVAPMTNKIYRPGPDLIGYIKIFVSIS